MAYISSGEIYTLGSRRGELYAQSVSSRAPVKIFPTAALILLVRLMRARLRNSAVFLQRHDKLPGRAETAIYVNMSPSARTTTLSRARPRERARVKYNKTRGRKIDTVRS